MLIAALVGVALVSYAAYRGGIIVHDAPVLQADSPNGGIGTVRLQAIPRP